ncbi:MAG: hypothetical protein Ta2F_16180 [Termitinemataceae bacterium]|nr:MAG: hypothetical protein Ta2F_16180 [Termitinemataceae bacterium]
MFSRRFSCRPATLGKVEFVSLTKYSSLFNFRGYFEKYQDAKKSKVINVYQIIKYHILIFNINQYHQSGWASALKLLLFTAPILSFGFRSMQEDYPCKVCAGRKIRIKAISVTCFNIGFNIGIIRCCLFILKLS